MEGAHFPATPMLLSINIVVARCKFVIQLYKISFDSLMCWMFTKVKMGCGVLAKNPYSCGVQKAMAYCDLLHIINHRPMSKAGCGCSVLYDMQHVLGNSVSDVRVHCFF